MPLRSQAVPSPTPRAEFENAAARPGSREYGQQAAGSLLTRHREARLARRSAQRGQGSWECVWCVVHPGMMQAPRFPRNINCYPRGGR